MVMSASTDQVSAVVLVYMALHGESHDDVAQVLDLTRPAVSSRLNGRTPWSLRDVDKLAAHYGVAPSAFLDPVPDVMTQLRRPGGLLDPLGRRRRQRRSAQPPAADDDAGGEPGRRLTRPGAAQSA